MFCAAMLLHCTAPHGASIFIVIRKKGIREASGVTAQSVALSPANCWNCFALCQRGNAAPHCASRLPSFFVCAQVEISITSAVAASQYPARTSRSVPSPPTALVLVASALGCRHLCEVAIRSQPRSLSPGHQSQHVPEEEGAMYLRRFVPPADVLWGTASSHGPGPAYVA
jgi:hypothetical protein